MELTITEEIYQQIAKSIKQNKKPLKDKLYARKYTAFLADLHDVDLAVVHQIADHVLAEPGFSQQLKKALVRYSIELLSAVIVGCLMSLTYWAYGEFGGKDSHLESARQSESYVNSASSSDLGNPPEPVIDPLVMQVIQASKFSNAFTSISMIKTVLTQDYMVDGSFPKTLEELGLDTGQLREMGGDANQGIKDASLGENGQIRVLLHENVGKNLDGSNIVIFVTPIIADAWNGIQLKWECKTTLKNHQVRFCQHDSSLIYKE